MSRYSCNTHGYFNSTVIKGDVPCPWCERDKLADEIEVLRYGLKKITCCESIQQAAIIANGALLKFAPITDEDMKWAKSVKDKL